MKAVVFAYNNIGCTGIEALLNAGIHIEAIFTYIDNPNENTWFKSVAKLAASKNIPTFSPTDVNNHIWIDKIKNMAPDFIFSFYYRNILKKEILDIPKYGSYNLHGSLLPKYRGRVPINWAIINGDSYTGVTLHKMTEAVDAGDIVIQKKINIGPYDDARTISLIADQASKEMLNEILPLMIKGDIPLVKQDNNKATYCKGRKPKDGIINWEQSAEAINNLIRGVTDPYPGAFTYFDEIKVIIWKGAVTDIKTNAKPGTIISTNPLLIVCGDGRAIEILFAQKDKDLYRSASQLVELYNIPQGYILSNPQEINGNWKKKILIIGANGFIGSTLIERLLDDDRFDVYGFDLNDSNIKHLKQNPKFYFFKGDIKLSRKTIEYHISQCDIILPLAAIATPADYIINPIKVFELDFEENLHLVRLCHKYNKRLIFPSTSEVYGMCTDKEFDEKDSNLILGPISKQRWIYSCSKQLLDRIIWAYGKDNLHFTLFRPFNWIGPKLDSFEAAKNNKARSITQMIYNLIKGNHITLVDGGRQKRCFTDISDGIECLYRIIINQGNIFDKKIINIGNPQNEASINEFARILVEEFDKHPLRWKFPEFAGYKKLDGDTFYGKGYQDCEQRKPNIERAFRYCGWVPKITIKESIKRSVDYIINEALKYENI